MFGHGEVPQRASNSDSEETMLKHNQEKGKGQQISLQIKLLFNFKPDQVVLQPPSQGGETSTQGEQPTSFHPLHSLGHLDPATQCPTQTRMLALLSAPLPCNTTARSQIWAGRSTRCPQWDPQAPTCTLPRERSSAHAGRRRLFLGGNIFCKRSRCWKCCRYSAHEFFPRVFLPASLSPGLSPAGQAGSTECGAVPGVALKNPTESSESKHYGSHTLTLTWEPNVVTDAEWLLLEQQQLCLAANVGDFVLQPHFLQV